MNKCKRMLCLQSFYYIRIRTGGTSVLKEALAIALPSRIKSFARKYASRSSRISSSVSKCESQLCCTRKSRLSFPCFNGFFFGFVDSDPISNSSYCLPYSSGDVGLENLVWKNLLLVAYVFNV